MTNDFIVTQKNIEEIIGELAKTGDPIFYNERNCQFRLGWKIYEKFKGNGVNVIFEYPYPIKLENNKIKKNYVDILVCDKNGNYIGIELKYKTKKLALDERFSLSTHSAVDFGCYDYLYDVTRLQSLCEENKPIGGKLTKCCGGYAIMLTNENGYWGSTRENSLYAEFCLDDKRILEQNPDWKIKKENQKAWLGWRLSNKLKIKQAYTIEWQKYCEANNLEGKDKAPVEFRYLILPVES